MPAKKSRPRLFHLMSLAQHRLMKSTDAAYKDALGVSNTQLGVLWMLEQRPGAFIFVGNGDSAGLHHPAYNFNDEAIPTGTSYWVRLAESALRG